MIPHFAQNINKPAQVLGATTDIPPKETLYINNLNDKIKPNELKISLYFLFSPFGEIKDIICKNSLRGQAFLVFSSTTSSTQALKTLQGFNFFGKPLRINFSRERSDVLSKQDGTWEPKEILKTKKRGLGNKKGEKKLKTENNSVAPGSQPLINSISQIAPPKTLNPVSNVLFLSNLAPIITEEMLQALFKQYDGLREIRLISAKKVAFVEYDEESQAKVALTGLNGFKISPEISLQPKFTEFFKIFGDSSNKSKEKKPKEKRKIKEQQPEFKIWSEQNILCSEIQDDYFLISDISYDDVNKEMVNRKMRKSVNIIVSETDYSDYILISDERPQFLSDDDWKLMFLKKDITLFPRRNIFLTLQKGITHNIRKDLWPLLAKVDELKLEYGKTYQELYSHNCEDEYGIKKDLLRTYPGHTFFDPKKKSEKNHEDGIDQLLRILRAYANLDPELGYTQGMNFIVAVLLINLDPYKNKDLNGDKEEIEFIDTFEEDVFWIFVHIMHKKGWRGVFADGTPELFKLLDKFIERLQLGLPKIYQHFRDLNVELYGTFSQYFLTLLMYKTPLKISKRIMDVFLLEGEEILFSILLKILKICEEEIKAKDDFELLFPFLRNELLDKAFSKSINSKEPSFDKTAKFPLNISNIERIQVTKK